MDLKTPGPASFSKCVINYFQNALLERKKRRVREKSGNLTDCLKKLLDCNLMISVSAEVLYQEALENSLRSGRGQGEVREKSGTMKIEKVATL